MVKRRLAVFVLRHILARHHGNIHHPAAAFFTIIGRLLHAVPESSVMNREVTGIDVQSNFFRIGLMVDEVFLLKQ